MPLHNMSTFNENSDDLLSSFDQDEKNLIVSIFLNNGLESNEPDRMPDLDTFPDSYTCLINDVDSSLIFPESHDWDLVHDSCEAIQELALDDSTLTMTSSSEEKPNNKRQNCSGHEDQEEAIEAPEKKKRKGRGRPKGSKRKEGFPKKALSAYNLFFRDERQRLLSSIEDNDEKKNIDFRKRKDRSDPHRKISFSELGKVIGQNWKNASEQTKKKYDDMAAVEKVAYDKKVEEYKRKTGTFDVAV